MARALSASNTLADACAMLLQQASSRQRFVWLGLVNVLLAGAALGVYLAVPEAGKSPLASTPLAEARLLPTLPASAPVLAKAVPAPEPEAPLPKAAEPAKTTASAPAPATGQRFYINVGLFAQDANARRAHTTLQKAGVAAFTQELDTGKGKRTRVRAGPFDTQSEADGAAEKIRALKLDAVVFQQ